MRDQCGVIGACRCRAAVIAMFLVISTPFPVISTLAHAQTAQEGKNLGALAESNLRKARPRAAVDLTGTYNFEMEGPPGTAFQFLPLPSLTPAAQATLQKKRDFAARGLEWRDDSAACWPLGVPMIMTRYWPIQVIQLPTEIVLISMFDNNIRWIYTDGRQHPKDDDLVLTYNGHSIGHWEGKELVVDTVGMTDDHHWIQPGVPAGVKLHVTERYSLSADRNRLQIEFNLTDPDNWIGEWKTKKHYTRDDHADIEEHICIYEQVSKLPGFDKDIRE